LVFLPYFYFPGKPKARTQQNPSYPSTYVKRQTVDYLTLLTILTGTLLVAVYVFRVHQEAAPAGLGNAIILFISASGFFGGARVIVFCFNSSLSVLAKDSGVDPALIVLGGLAMAWASTLPIMEIFRRVAKPPKRKKS
jgi:hypothetical protein